MARKRKQDNKSIINAFSLILQLGINMLVPIVLCFIIGNWLYRRFDMAALLLIFILIGIGAAFTSCYRLIRKMFFDKNENT